MAISMATPRVVSKATHDNYRSCDECEFRNRVQNPLDETYWHTRLARPVKTKSNKNSFFYLTRLVNGLYGIMDAKDCVEEFYTLDQVLSMVNDFQLRILGVSASGRVNVNWCNDDFCTKFISNHPDKVDKIEVVSEEDKSISSTRYMLHLSDIFAIYYIPEFDFEPHYSYADAFGTESCRILGSCVKGKLVKVLHKAHGSSTCGLLGGLDCTYVDLFMLDLTDTDTLENAFSVCSIDKLVLDYLDVSGIRNFRGVFELCVTETIDISAWNISDTLFKTECIPYNMRDLLSEIVKELFARYHTEWRESQLSPKRCSSCKYGYDDLTYQFVTRFGGYLIDNIADENLVRFARNLLNVVRKTCSDYIVTLATSVLSSVDVDEELDNQSFELSLCTAGDETCNLWYLCEAKYVDLSCFDKFSNPVSLVIDMDGECLVECDKLLHIKSNNIYTSGTENVFIW